MSRIRTGKVTAYITLCILQFCLLIQSLKAVCKLSAKNQIYNFLQDCRLYYSALLYLCRTLELQRKYHSLKMVNLHNHNHIKYYSTQGKYSFLEIWKNMFLCSLQGPPSQTKPHLLHVLEVKRSHRPILSHSEHFKSVNNQKFRYE